MRNILKNPLKVFFPKKIVGIDIGTSSIKVVEVSRWGEGKTLENYGEIKSDTIYKEPVNSGEKGDTLLSTGFVSTAIKAIMEEAKIKTKAVIFSIPDFSTFCTSFEIPAMSEKEVPEAIKYSAAQHITLPISEVALDWRIVSSDPTSKTAPLKIFLVAIPNQVVKEYQDIAKNTGLELYALEAEAWGLARAFIKSSKKTICVMDIGVQSSTINIIDDGFLKRSYSFNFYSSQLAKAVSSALSLEYDEASEITNREGILSTREGVAQTLYLLVDPLLAKIRGISSEFLQSEQKEVEEVYLTGGTANLPGLKEYFQEMLKKKVTVPNCFSDLLYPPILEETLKEMSPSFSVATGVALGGLEK